MVRQAHHGEGILLTTAEADWREARGDYVGWCEACGSDQQSHESDARRYDCEACGRRTAFGAEDAEEWIANGWLEFVEPLTDATTRTSTKGRIGALKPRACGRQQAGQPRHTGRRAAALRHSLGLDGSVRDRGRTQSLSTGPSTGPIAAGHALSQSSRTRSHAAGRTPPRPGSARRRTRPARRSR